MSPALVAECTACADAHRLGTTSYGRCNGVPRAGWVEPLRTSKLSARESRGNASRRDNTRRGRETLWRECKQVRRRRADVGNFLGASSRGRRYKRRRRQQEVADTVYVNTPSPESSSFGDPAFGRATTSSRCKSAGEDCAWVAVHCDCGARQEAVCTTLAAFNLVKAVHDKNEIDDAFMSKLVFSDEATFQSNGKVNRHNVRIWEADRAPPPAFVTLADGELPTLLPPDGGVVAKNSRGLRSRGETSEDCTTSAIENWGWRSCCAFDIIHREAAEDFNFQPLVVVTLTIYEDMRRAVCHTSTVDDHGSREQCSSEEGPRPSTVFALSPVMRGCSSGNMGPELTPNLPSHPISKSLSRTNHWSRVPGHRFEERGEE
ncbi:hypothetical protein PR048_028770 [Dryococelus australis]|uniref:Uncharacterized protein n=1 Tax=Dryococelus australis TaxID=614101 RepID=A0ABQ9GC47_9NEOP|nr:hypothetical protein PR048_028770 [Dryococelus australis]